MTTHTFNIGEEKVVYNDAFVIRVIYYPVEGHHKVLKFDDRKKALIKYHKVKHKILAGAFKRNQAIIDELEAA
tara:strand:- start:329 stop:547 length:219 start_codon:yes stop_codon:yes gene_type:complete